MTLEDWVMASTVVVVLVSSMDLVISSDMPINMSTIIVSSADLIKVSGIIIATKLVSK